MLPSIRRRAKWRQVGASLLVLAGSAGTVRSESTAAPAASSSAVTDGALAVYYAGNGLLNRGLYDLAAAEYRTFLARWPEHEKATTARYGLAVSLFRLDRCADAQTELEALARQEDLSYGAEVGVMLGRCRFVQGDAAGAAKAYEAVLANYGQHTLAVDAALGAAEAMQRLERREDVIRFCEVVRNHAAEGPGRDRCDLLSAEALMALNRDAEAVRVLGELRARKPGGALGAQAGLLESVGRQRLGESDAAAEGYRAVIESGQEPLLPDALYGLAVILARQGQQAEAAALLDRLLAMGGAAPHQAEARLERARLWFDAGNDDRAAALLEDVAGTNGDLADEASYRLGKCRLRQGRFVDAARLLAEAIERYDQSALAPWMTFDRAVALSRAGDVDASSSVGRRFLEDYPGHALEPDVLYLLASQSYAAGDAAATREAAERLLERYDKHVLARAARLLLAEAEFLQGRLDQAVSHYRAVLADSAPPGSGETISEGKEAADDESAELARYRLGTALYRLNRLEEAATFLTEAADRAAATGQHRAALLTLGDLHVRRGEWKQAEVRLRQYLAAKGDVPAADDAQFKLGLSLQRQDRPAEALAAYDQFLARFSDSPHRSQVVFERGQMLLALGRAEEAAAAFEAILAAAPEGPLAAHARRHLANIAMGRGDFGRAAEEFGRLSSAGEDASSIEARLREGEALLAAGRFAPALDVFESMGREASDRSQAASVIAGRAIALSRLDRCEEALVAIEQAESKLADRMDPAARQALRYEKAWCLRQSGKSPEAESAYRAVLAADGNSSQANHARLDLSGILMDRKGFEEARALLIELVQRKVETADPLAEVVSYRLAVCDHELGHHEDARRRLGQFVERFPESEMLASALYLLGASSAEVGRHEEAARSWRRMVDEFPSSVPAAAARLRLAESLLALQRWSAAEDAFGQFLEHHPDHAQAYQAQFGIGWARENQQRYEEARRAYANVTAGHQGPTAARAQFQFGECLFAEKKYEEAVTAFLKVDILYAYPEWSAAALYEAGRCFELLGRTTEARGQFQAVAERYAESSWAKPARERLDARTRNEPPGH